MVSKKLRLNYFKFKLKFYLIINLSKIKYLKYVIYVILKYFKFITNILSHYHNHFCHSYHGCHHQSQVSGDYDAGDNCGGNLDKLIFSMKDIN